MSELKKRTDEEIDGDTEEVFESELEDHDVEEQETKVEYEETDEPFVELLNSLDVDQWDILDAVPRDVLFYSIMREENLRDGIKSLYKGVYTKEAFIWLEQNKIDTLLDILQVPRDDIEIREQIEHYFNQVPKTILVKDLVVPKRTSRISLCAYNREYRIVAVEFSSNSSMTVFKKNARKCVVHSKYVDISLVAITPYLYINNHEEIDEYMARDDMDCIIVSKSRVNTKIGDWEVWGPERFYQSIYDELKQTLSNTSG